MASARDYANYIVAFFQECEDPITNLKLQKLLYYVQGWHLALLGKPAFDEPLQAWVHGPVQPGVYHEFKRYRWNPIADAVTAPALSDESRAVVDEVLEAYGVESAYELERRTHREPPWLAARGDLPLHEESTAEISLAEMKNYFEQLAHGADSQATH